MFKYYVTVLIIISICINAQAMTLNPQDLMKSAHDNHWDNYSTEKLKELVENKNTDFYSLGLLYLAHDDFKQSLDFFKESKKDSSIFFQSYIYYQLEDYDKSLKFIIYYSKKNKNTSAYSLMINILNDSGEFNKLDTVFDQVDKLNLYTTPIRYKKAMYDLSEGKCLSAIKNFLLILKQSPLSTIVNKPLGNAYRQCNKPELAKTYMTKESSGTIIDNDPLLVHLYEFGNPAILLKPKLDKFIKARKYNEAIIIAEELIAIQSNDENIWINYGTLLTKLKNYEMAISAFESAYELNTSNELTLKNLIKTYWGFDKDKANKWIDKLLLVNPKHAIALRIKGDYLISIGKKDEAIAFYKKALFVSPENTLVLLILSKYYLNLKDYNQAINMLENSFKHSGNNITIANYLARTLIISNPKDNDVSQRALRIARTIYKLRADYTNKFTLLMALRANKLNEEAAQIRDELLLIPLKPSQNKFKTQLDILENYGKFVNNINVDWLW